MIIVINLYFYQYQLNIIKKINLQFLRENEFIKIYKLLISFFEIILKIIKYIINLNIIVGRIKYQNNKKRNKQEKFDKT